MLDVPRSTVSKDLAGFARAVLCAMACLWAGSAFAVATLSVTKFGSGSGTVVSSSGGINCGSTCSAQFASPASVTLSATAAAGSTFFGWAGACAGRGTCTVNMNATTAVTAIFNLPMAVSAGSFHSLALGADGNLRAWGWDAYSQLGAGRQGNSAYPVQVQPLNNATALAAGDAYSVALRNDGTVWGWGLNDKGQLGDGTLTDRPVAVRVRGLSAIVAISAKLAYTLALASDGTVWAWGDNSSGQLGDGSTATRSTPVRVTGLSGVLAIQAGYSHSFAIKGDGTLWAWGSNSSGQLGDGTTTDRLTPVKVNTTASILAVSASTRHSAAIRSDGAVLVWGFNAGDNSVSDRRLPQVVAGLATVTSISGGEDYTVMSRSNGTVFAWGREPSGHLSPPIPTTALRQVTGLPTARSVEATKSHVFVLGQDGTVWGWGTNLFGELGSGTTAFTEILTPLRVIGLSGVTRLAAGAMHTQALLGDGSIWAWGYNWVGAFGDGAVSRRSVPVPVVDVAGLSSIVAAGVHSVALKDDGTVWTWGFAVAGSLCDGTPTYTTRARPVQVAGLADVISIAADSNPLNGRTIAVKADGTVWECGWDGSSGTSTPRQIAGIDNVVAISAGSYFLAALRRDGSVWKWSSSSAPSPVSGLSGVVAIAAQNSNVIALRGDGTVIAQGPDFGLSPVVASGLSDVVAISPSAAVTRDGRVWTLTYAVGQLLPTVIPGLADIVAFASSGHKLAVRRDGVVFSFGFNGGSGGSIGGQLGDGTYIDRPNPVVVLREGGAGAIDGGNWFLRLEPTAPILPILSANTPKMVAVAQAEGPTTAVTLDASAKFKAVHSGKNVNVYVLAEVPPSFFNLVKLAPGAKTAQELAKAGKTVVLAQLTPAGWSVVIGGQLIPYSQAVANAAGAATNILNGINLDLLQGARFCIGYGESAQSMLSEQTLRDVLALPGASSTTDGLPCLLTGAYIDGPASSMAGSPVTFKASVIGVEPTGTVQFRGSSSALFANVPLATSSAAVANALHSTQALETGTHSVTVDYSGDARNAARSADIPLRHEVRAAQATARVDLSGPVSSLLASPVVFTARVTGNNPTGAVQFRDGSASLGAAEPLVGGVATLRIATLNIGSRSISAAYLGDVGNAPASSAVLVHQVFAALNSDVTLDVNQGTVDFGAPLTFTATVSGTNPTGSVVIRDDAAVIGSANLTQGSASVTVSNLAGGLHWITATYSGDGGNQTVTSAAIVVAVRAPPQATPPANPPRVVNIATRMQVKTGADVLIGGFIIGGSAPKTVVVRARGPSLTALGVPGALANPVLNLYSGQTVIASNDNFGTAANVATLQASGFAPANALEAAIHVTLNPGPYTAIVSGAGGATGVGIIEVFEVDTPQTPLINIATRGQVLTGDDVMIGGFVIQGSGPQMVVVRARGPSLTALGVPGALANPVLNLYSGQTVIASNDNWQTASNAATLQSIGFAPTDANEAAILITLNPGAYTAIVSGTGGATGVGIVEVFAVP